MAENTENSEVLTAAETADEIPDYSLPFTGDEVAAAISKVHKMKMGKVSITPQMTSGGGASILNALSGYTNPVVFLSLETLGAVAHWNRGASTASNDLVITISPVGTGGLNTGTAYTVDYLIAEGG